MKPRPSHAEGLLPSWIIVPVLGSLIAVSAVIVAAGWLMARPAAVIRATPVAAAMPAVQREVSATVAAIPETEEPRPRLLAEPPVVPPEEPIRPDARTPSPAIKLERRSPAPTEARQRPVIREEPRKEEPGRIRWIMESPTANAPQGRADELNLIPRVEVAKIETGPIHYSMRRLALAEPKPLRLAVTPHVYDDMASLLTQMGPGYRFSNIPNEDTYSFDKLKSYDVLFLTCSAIYPQDYQSTGPLRRFVEMGGTLYASDLRGDLLQSAFPEFRARSLILPGVPQNIDANVMDKGLQSYLGRKIIPLSFDAPGWRPAAFDAGKVTVCLKGVYRNNLGQAFTVPLLVKFPVKRGTVIFTSFHNSRNDSEIVKKVLEYLVFASINARSEARLKELMQRSNFAPQDLRPVLVSANKMVEATHQHKGGGLQIALGFENVGAKLKLTLLSPSGQMIEHEDQGLYLIEVPRADPGTWRYTLTPIDLPYPNLPVVVALGAMKS